jgi:hypothetical protein
MIYDSLEPFGPRAANLNAALITSMIANVNRGKDSQAISPIDLAFGDFSEEREQKRIDSVEQMQEKLMKFVEATNPKKKKKKK